MIVLSPVVQIPVELEKLFAAVEHELPNRQQIEDIARGVATEEGELPKGPEFGRVLDAAVGLTRYEVENAFALSLLPQSPFSRVRSIFTSLTQQESLYEHFA